MAEVPVLNRNTAISLLRLPGDIFMTEDLQHSWSNNCFSPFEILFLRTWDHNSGSQPDENRMMARAPRQRLDTLESRRISLNKHIDHKVWKPTPYISFTTSPAAVQEMAVLRSKNRGAQTLTVLNPNVRIADRLPILDVLAEMDHYGITDPYKKSSQYYKDHYLCV